MTARPCRSPFAPFDGTISIPAAGRTNGMQATALRYALRLMPTVGRPNRSGDKNG